MTSEDAGFEKTSVVGAFALLEGCEVGVGCFTVAIQTQNETATEFGGF